MTNRVTILVDGLPKVIINGRAAEIVALVAAEYERLNAARNGELCFFFGEGSLRVDLREQLFRQGERMK